MTYIDELTPSDLALELVAKHEKFVENFRREYEILERVDILEEKRDQLSHWLNSEEHGMNNDKISESYKQVEKEINDLFEEYEQKMGSFQQVKPSARRGFLESRIQKHEKALNYWEKRRRKLLEGEYERE